MPRTGAWEGPALKEAAWARRVVGCRGACAPPHKGRGRGPKTVPRTGAWEGPE